MRTHLRAKSRYLLAAALTAVFSTAASAQYYGYGSTATFLNTYFLPSTAPISGVSGLIFGVVLPLGIVMIMLYTALEQLQMFNGRQAKALAVLVSLFIIPSGAYKVISEFFIGLFSLGGANLGGYGTFTIPGLGTAGTHIIIGVLAFFASALIINRIVLRGSPDFTITEYVASLGVGFAVWLALEGGVGIVGVFFGWIILLWLGWEVFKRGTGAGGLTGIGVGLVGLFIIFTAMSSFKFLPESVRNISAALSAVVPVVAFIVVISIIGIAAAYIIWGNP
ncbi:MAG: hypothetical protein SVQ76_01305 [Candidatus Nanohaloarchaea archaeon]|nr:hypothetical protein [Candidatus Nanohaloarchaea archaeon]